MTGDFARDSGAVRAEYAADVQLLRSGAFRSRHFPEEPLTSADYERAAEHFTACRAAGVQESNTEFLICAVAERRQMPILTTDRDFVRFAAILPIVLHG